MLRAVKSPSWRVQMSIASLTRPLLLAAFAALLSPSPISGDQYGLADDQHPSVVHLEISGDARTVPGCCPRCTGILISLKHVVTTATCLWISADTTPKAEDIQVYAGSSEVSGHVFTENRHVPGYGACSRSVQIVTARDIIYHPAYMPQLYQLRHDVAIVVVPRLHATRYVAPAALAFDMFDSGIGTSHECKMVGYSIFKSPRAGYHNLLTWLLPMTRWEKDVTVTNGCRGRPVDWGNKKWASMIESELCSKIMYSSDSRPPWTDKGAALICNGFLVGLAHGQFEDGGKLDLTLQPSADPGKMSKHQTIFFNMKYLTELIVLRMKATNDLQWSGEKGASELEVNSPDPLLQDERLKVLQSTSDNETLMTDFAWSFKFAKEFLNASSELFTVPPTTSPLPTSNQTCKELKNSTITLTLSTANFSIEAECVEQHDPLANNELPELEMNLVTKKFDGEDLAAKISVDDLFNENNPFNTSWTQTSRLALVLNGAFPTACTGVFISPRYLLTAASCLVRHAEQYEPLSSLNYRVVAGHSNGMVDFCSERVRTYGVRNVKLLNEGRRQNWQIYSKSRITPFTEIYNLAILTIDGAHLNESVYPPINQSTWRLRPYNWTHEGAYPANPFKRDVGDNQGSEDESPPSDLEEYYEDSSMEKEHLEKQNTTQTDSTADFSKQLTLLKSFNDGPPKSSTPNKSLNDSQPVTMGDPLKLLSNKESRGNQTSATLRCRMFGYGHKSIPYTNLRNRIGVKILDLDIIENCTHSFSDDPLGEESRKLWQIVEQPHFLCAASLSPEVELSGGSLGSPLYCGQDDRLVGIYIGRYNNASFDSYLNSTATNLNTSQPTSNISYTHVFLKLSDYSEWIVDPLPDEQNAKLRRTHLNLAPPMDVLDWTVLCLLSLGPRLLGWFAQM